MRFKTISLIIIFVVSVTILSRLYERIPLNASDVATRIASPELSNFDFNIKTQKVADKNIYIYRVDFPNINIVDAKIYGGLFGYKNECYETKDSFLFEDLNSNLVISKSDGSIIYRAKKIKELGKTITKDEAVELAVQFINSTLSTLKYDYCEVECDEQNIEYSVKFIGSIDGKKNYAYPLNVVLDKSGNITALDYYRFIHTKHRTASIISTKKATEVLSQTYLADDITVDIKNAEIIFILDDNFLIPAYLFKGELPGNYDYQQIVPALVPE